VTSVAWLETKQVVGGAGAYCEGQGDVIFPGSEDERLGAKRSGLAGKLMNFWTSRQGAIEAV
jgi:hypothetical protein